MLENGKKKLIYGLIGFGCGIALSGIIMLVVILNIDEYQKGLITYISSSDEQKEDIRQDNTTQPSSIEEDLVNDDLKIQDTIIDNTLSDQEIIEHSNIEDMISDQEAIEESTVLKNNRDESRNITVYIPQYSTAVRICKILQEQGVILDAEDFANYIKANNKTKKLRSGKLILSPQSSYEELLKQLEAK